MSHWKQVTFEKGYSQREENIVYNSFRYVKNAPHPKEPTQYWKCAYKGCLSRAKTNKDDHTIGYINHAEHSHLPDIIKRKIEGIRHDFNLKAVATLDTPKSIIVSSKSNLGPETLARMPHDTSISRSIRRSRKSDEFTDPELRVQQAMEIILPDELTITSQGSRFLLYDSITDDTMKDIKHRALVFISNKGLHSLVQAPNWSCDGTFRTLANPQNFIDNDPYMKEPIEINPNFPIDLWNVRNRIADALPFTNNSLEAYHGNLQKAHDRVKQPFDLFINLIIKEEAARETQLTQLLVKPYEGKQKKQYRINSEQASALVKNHPLDNNQQILAFLKAVAFHLMNFEYYAEVGAAEDEYCHDT
uniref:FLYWCH-type domain-containing protein n=1 Tax=Acrobeloides nanus TaxID=290746 RepID=A0A914EK65_9BILA